MPPVSRFNPALGVRSDFEMLLNKFTETNSVRFEQFSQLWRDMNMSCIFMGKPSEDELRVFITEAMRIAVELWMPTQNLQIRVGALYLLYALYFKQIFPVKIKIPITLEQWKNALEFAAEIREQHHLDVDYIFCKLRHSNAFHFTALPNKLHLHSRVEEEQVPPTSTLTSGQDQQSILAAILPPENIDQLSAIHEQYHQMKCALGGISEATPVTSLNVIQPTLVQNITRSVAAFEEWRKTGGKKDHRKRRDSGQTTTSESEADSDVDQWLPSSAKKNRSKLSATGRRRAEIRDRAFSSVSHQGKARRHRQGRSESEKESSSSPSKRSRKPAPFQSPTTSISEEEKDCSPVHPSLGAPLLDMPSSLIAEESSPEIKAERGKGKGKGSSKQVKNPGKNSNAGRSEKPSNKFPKKSSQSPGGNPGANLKQPGRSRGRKKK